MKFNNQILRKMKALLKLFVMLFAVALFAACGNTEQEAEVTEDTVATEEVAVEEEATEEVADTLATEEVEVEEEEAEEVEAE